MNEKTLPKKSTLLKSKVVYSLTVCPNDKHQKWTSVNRYGNAIKAIRAKLSSLSYCEYSLHPEISNKGRIHFHGTISILQVVPFLLYDIRKISNIGIYELDSISDRKVWDAYCQKDKKVMKRYLNQIGEPYLVTNIVPEKAIQNFFTPVDIEDSLQTLEGSSESGEQSENEDP